MYSNNYNLINFIIHSVEVFSIRNDIFKSVKTNENHIFLAIKINHIFLLQY